MIRRKPTNNNVNVGGPSSGPAENPTKKRTKVEDVQAQKAEDDKQEGLAKELLRLTSSLKHNFTAAGSVLKEDNAVCEFYLNLK
jgi:hypothetical protein